ncbi:MAG: hypothetical protein Q8Q62_20660 [Mesorhizobium sp.]|nr:hypothetical protein [Mesorhizobium sp.]
MTTNPPLTRTIGETERTLQALLQRYLATANISFQQWTVLVYLAGVGQLSRSALVGRLVDGRIATAEETEAVLASMHSRSLIATATRGEDAVVFLSDAGKGAFAPLRERITAITGSLFDDLPAADLAATRRTLETVTRRAGQLLSPNVA